MQHMGGRLKASPFPQGSGNQKYCNKRGGGLQYKLEVTMHCNTFLIGREVQNCELKKCSVFRVMLASQIGILRGFQPSHIGTLDFAQAVFRGHLRILLQKKHTENLGKYSVENSVKTLIRSSVRFSVSNCLPRNRKNSRKIRSAREIPYPKNLLRLFLRNNRKG